MLEEDPNCIDIIGNTENNYTPLHEAAKHGQVSTTTLLIDKGANLKAKDDIGDTPVHLAAQFGHVG